MFSTFIAYDTGTGRIVGVHHGPEYSTYTWQPEAKFGPHLAVLRGPFPQWRDGKRYRVDAARQELVEVATEQGIDFGFGSSGGTSDKK